MNGYRKKFRKRVLIPMMLFLVAGIAAGGSILYVNNHRVQVSMHKYHNYYNYYGEEPVIAYEYKDEHGSVLKYEQDYPEIYQEELRIIFGEDCEIGKKNTIFVEGDDCDCGISESSYQYNTWEVTYHDRRGETFTQMIDNRDSLQSLQCSWLESHLEQYYDKKYLMDFFEEGTFQELTEITHCSVSIGIGGYSYLQDQKEEFDRIGAGGRKYQEQLIAAYREKDTMLRITELDYEVIYKHYPMKVRFFLSIDDRELSGEEKAVHEKAVQDRVLR